MDKEKFVKEMYEDLVGLKITEIRPMTATELEYFGWSENRGEIPPIVLFLGDEAALVPQKDPEGNGPGFLAVRFVAMEQA